MAAFDVEPSTFVKCGHIEKFVIVFAVMSLLSLSGAQTSPGQSIELNLIKLLQINSNKYFHPAFLAMEVGASINFLSTCCRFKKLINRDKNLRKLDPRSIKNEPRNLSRMRSRLVFIICDVSELADGVIVFNTDRGWLGSMDAHLGFIQQSLLDLFSTVFKHKKFTEFHVSIFIRVYIY